MQATAYVNLTDASKAQCVSPELVLPMGELMTGGVAAGLGAADLASLVDPLRLPQPAT
jgi:hypothetical protein